jgi:hypothetical protein
MLFGPAAEELASIGKPHHSPVAITAKNLGKIEPESSP